MAPKPEKRNAIEKWLRPRLFEHPSARQAYHAYLETPNDYTSYDYFREVRNALIEQPQWPSEAITAFATRALTAASAGMKDCDPIALGRLGLLALEKTQQHGSTQKGKSSAFDPKAEHKTRATPRNTAIVEVAQQEGIID